MEPYIVVLITMFGSILAASVSSAGLWTYLSKRDTQKNANTQLLRGLAHDRIIFLGMKYLDRGFVTKDEYEDLIKYLWVPYSASGGNGLAEKIMKDVQNLPMRGDSPYPHVAAQVIHVKEEQHVISTGTSVTHTE